MAKIQRRISGDDLQEKLPEFSGQKINIVKKDNRVSFIYLDAVEGSILRGRNMRLTRVTFPLDTIKEVIVDLKATDAD
jgi:hypothetical protein